MTDENKTRQEEILIGQVGGEALMEGIMMRGPKGAAIALRLPDGSIETTVKAVKSPKDYAKCLAWPLIRGPVNLVHSMVFGYKCMMESAEKTTLDAIDASEPQASKIDQWLAAHFGEKMMAVIGAIGMVLGLALAFGLFVWMPAFLFQLLNGAVEADLSRFAALIEGAVRITLFVGYMFVMSQIKDIRRVFQYHGAEHKAIFCYENGLPLTVENVRAQKRLHPRCGTSFLFLMLLLSILVSSLVMYFFPQLADALALRVAIKVLQFPLIMAIGYEFIRFAGRHLQNPLVRVISAPGLAMQKITTKEPDDGIIEVGIQALKAALGMPFEPLVVPAKEALPE
ncbi:MAG: DUF1385 domain-containing protein [Oscillospiraceae bacterium]|jgi:uncharacterized protein YqhQ|nr:DUF1385 domain-containing protein [Oscillospiraceae bacterium]